VASAAGVGPRPWGEELRRGLRLWWRFGPRLGTEAVARELVRRGRGPLRARRLRRRPPQVGARELAEALGTADPADALHGRVFEALPAVAAFALRLDEMPGGERERVLARAERIAAHHFHVPGAGEVDLGPEIDWHRDPSSGRRWPLDHMFTLRLGYPDGSDVHRVWELSRCQHLPVLAAGERLAGDGRYARELRRQLLGWIAHNPVEFGVGWACTMEAAIRAANWTAALALCPDHALRGAWLEPVVASLLLHGRFIRRRHERRTARNNHYVADLTGLLVLAGLFWDGDEGRAWADFAARELVREMDFQVRPDGCAFEASIPYHALVTELFLAGTDAVDALLPGALPDWYRERLGRMLGFVSDYVRQDGVAPQVGDGDDGRFLPLDRYGGDPRSHTHLLTGPPGVGHAAYPQGGFWMMRGGGLNVLVRCGDVGNAGLGWHAHNDALSFELASGAQPLVIDPGTFSYADPDARRTFRSVSSHSTLRVGGREQHDFSGDHAFLLRERAHAEVLAWRPRPDGCTFEGRCRSGAAVHRRRLELDAGARALTLEDTVEGAAGQALEWTFPLAPAWVDARGSRAEACFAGARLVVESEGLDLKVEPGWWSPRYGVRVCAPFVRARRLADKGQCITRFRLTVLPD
jgi:heparinase II/III-like protein